MEDLKTIFCQVFNGQTVKVYLLSIVSYFSSYANLHQVLTILIMAVTIIYTIIKIYYLIKNKGK